MPSRKPRREQIGIRESPERAHRQSEIELLEPPLEALARSDVGRNRLAEEPLVLLGFPGRVAIVLLNPDGDRRIGEVIELVHKPKRLALELDVFMGFVVARWSSGRDRHGLVSPELVFEQAQVPGLGIAAMTNAPAQKVILHVQIETVGLIGGRAAGDLFGKLGNHNFIGIDDEYPLVAKRQVIESPVLLLGVRAVEMKLDDRAPCSSATWTVSSVLWLSTTKTSSAQWSAGRQRFRFSASFLTGTSTLTAAFGDIFFGSRGKESTARAVSRRSASVAQPLEWGMSFAPP